jgi:serine/threonine protein kinase
MAAESRCPDPLHLQQLLLGRLPAKTAERLEAHVHQCDRCGDLLPTLLQDDTLVDAVRARAKPGLQQHERDLVEGLMVRLKQSVGSHDTTTEANTLGAHADDASRQLCSFLAPPQNSDELGRLGGYRVLKVLGHGGMGVVFLAEDPHLKRSVAVKAMLPEVARKAMARERFLREARAAAALEHDHIVPIYHVGEERGVPFLVMPFLKGASLEDFARLRRGEPGASVTGGGLTVGQILKVGREIATGLAAAQEAGLIHRDIKPANIWLDAGTGGRVRILDFGLARATSDDANLTSPGLIVGTPSYMAPEQAQGRPVDGRADLFSLGCVLYKLCTGQVPFRGKDVVSTLLLTATKEPEPIEASNQDAPPALCDLVRRLMAKNPQDRPRSAQSVAEEIAAIERALSNAHSKVAALVNPEVSPPQALTVASATVATDKNPYQKQRRNWPWVATGVLAVMAVALTGFIVIRITNKDGTVTEVKVSAVARFADVDKRMAAIQKLPAEGQVKEVAKWLVELNPGFDGQVTHKIEQGVVRELQFMTDAVKNITPVQVLTGLRSLTCAGTPGKGEPDKGRLADLSPLRGMRLTFIHCGNNPLTDLAPLQDMKLITLNCSGTHVGNLTPLQNMPLTTLNCSSTRIADLSPLRGMKLNILNCAVTQVADLTPLQGMPLTNLSCTATQVTDLSPLKDMKLILFHCPFNKIADLTPLQGMPLTNLHCHNTLVTDMSILKDMPLQELRCDFKAERDATLLRSIKTLASINGMAAAEFWQQFPPAKP